MQVDMIGRLTASNGAVAALPPVATGAGAGPATLDSGERRVRQRI